MTRGTVGFWQNFRSRLDAVLSVRCVDDHFIIRFFGIKFCKKFPVQVDFEEINEIGVSQTSNQVKVIVSLTSFPARINTVYKTITTLMRQTVKADKIILWLAEEQFPDKILPQNLTRLQDYGLTIKWCEDIRSYKKLIPALAEYPEDIIITADDDYYYDKNLIKTLLNEHKKNPDCIAAIRAMRLVPKHEKFRLIRRSYIYDDTYLPSFLNFFVGYGGVLYPPHSLHKNVLNKKEFTEIIPTNDDAWFWLHAVRNGTKIVPCKDGYKLKHYVVENSQTSALCKVNCNNSVCGIKGEDAANMFMGIYPDAKSMIDTD